MDARSSESEADQWQDSIQELCESYWYPLYAFLRRKGYKPEDCQDLVQGFFASLIEKDFLKVVSPDKGRFRWFLMDAIAKFAASWNSAQSAQKRGGQKTIVSLDVDQGESRYGLEPADQQTPESLFERDFALSVIDQAIEALKSSYYEDGKKRFFDSLKVYLVPAGHEPKYAEVATELDLSETAIKVAIHRLRQKFQDSVRLVVLQTLSDPSQLDEEVDSLLQSLG